MASRLYFLTWSSNLACVRVDENCVGCGEEDVGLERDVEPMEEIFRPGVVYVGLDTVVEDLPLSLAMIVTVRGGQDISVYVAPLFFVSS